MHETIKQALDICRNLLNNGSYIETIAILEQCLKIEKNKEIVLLLGDVYTKTKNPLKAIYTYNLIEPDDEILNLLSISHASIGEIDKAIEYINKCLEINPKDEYKSNLAIQFKNACKFEESKLILDDLLIKDPNNPNYLTNMASLYAAQMIPEKAEIYYKLAKEKMKNNHLNVDISFCCFLQGKWQEGWELYEERLNQLPQMEKINALYPLEKRWKGEKLENKKLCVFCEQGNGDFIQFSRYLPFIPGNNILLHCNIWLERLFKCLENDKIKVSSDIEEHDYNCSIMSLPYLLKIPKIEQPIIKINEKLNIPFDGKKIGICWAGNPMHSHDSTRSTYLKYFKCLMRPDTKLFSLQKDYRSVFYPHLNKIVDYTENSDGVKAVDMSEFMNDFYDTAKIINSMDVVVTIDTSIAHIAGSINKETYLLLAFNHDWRWKDNSWYPSIKILRQKEPKNWVNLFSEINI